MTNLPMQVEDLVSVIIPCYNHAHFLSEAIDSVMAQTWRHFQIIVVDDGSSDNTRDVAARYASVRYLYQSNQGLAASRNAGLRHSDGKFIVFLDADDRLRPEALETALRLLNENTGWAFVAGRCQHITADGSLLSSMSPSSIDITDYYAALLNTNFILNPASVMYRRSVFQSVKPFDSSVNAAADYDLYLRIARQYPIYCHEDVVVEYRRHSTNMSSNVALMFKAVLTVLGSQRDYVRTHPEFKPSYDKGMQIWRNCLGAGLTEEVIAKLRMRQLSKRLLYDLYVLSRYYRGGFGTIGTRAYRKLSSKIFRKIFSPSC